MRRSWPEPPRGKDFRNFMRRYQSRSQDKRNKHYAIWNIDEKEGIDNGYQDSDEKQNLCVWSNRRREEKSAHSAEKAAQGEQTSFGDALTHSRLFADLFSCQKLDCWLSTRLAKWACLIDKKTTHIYRSEAGLERFTGSSAVELWHTLWWLRAQQFHVTLGYLQKLAWLMTVTSASLPGNSDNHAWFNRKESKLRSWVTQPDFRKLVTQSVSMTKRERLPRWCNAHSLLCCQRSSHTSITCRKKLFFQFEIIHGNLIATWLIAASPLNKAPLGYQFQFASTSALPQWITQIGRWKVSSCHALESAHQIRPFD